MDVCDCLRRVPVVCATLAVLAAAGCSKATGPTLYPVHGQVFFQGKPAAGARVVFHLVPRAAENPLDIPKPSGVVKEDGSYTLSTYPHGEGAAPGEYRVVVVWLGEAAGANATIPNRLPDKYAHVEKSGLKATVQNGPTDVPAFQLTK
ncbi:MAG TPA: hypothetical protein VGF55_13935 [Gemmataceae bacterium]|jgi:hypothetical protein